MSRRVNQSERLRRKEIKKREKQVQFVLDLFPSFQLLGNSNDPKKLPISRLMGATSQYVSGFFESSILESSFAVEYALLLKLNKTLDPNVKDEIAKRGKGLGLSNSVKLAKDILKDEQMLQDLDVLENLRNMSAHPGNWVTVYNRMNEMLLNEDGAKNWVTKVTHQSPEGIVAGLKDDFDIDKAKKTAENIRAYKDQRWGNLPNLEWATNRKTLEKQIEIVRKHSERLIVNMIQRRQILKVTSEPQSAPEYLMSKYRYPQEFALKAITTAYDVLIYLKLI